MLMAIYLHAFQWGTFITELLDINIFMVAVSLLVFLCFM